MHTNQKRKLKSKNVIVCLPGEMTSEVKKDAYTNEIRQMFKGTDISVDRRYSFTTRAFIPPLRTSKKERQQVYTLGYQSKIV